MPKANDRASYDKSLKKMLRGVKTPVVIGDNILWQHDPADSSKGIITALLPRENQLARIDSHNKSLWHVFAANIDQLIIVASCAMPDLKPGLIDRYLIIAAMNDIPATLVITKPDLAPDGYQDIVTLCIVPSRSQCLFYRLMMRQLRQQPSMR